VPRHSDDDVGASLVKCASFVNGAAVIQRAAEQLDAATDE
jgi:hypothetical protein